MSLISTLSLPLLLRQESAQAISQSVLSLVLLFGMAAFYRWLLNRWNRFRGRMLAACTVLGLVLSCSLTFGARLTDVEQIAYGDPWLYVAILTGTLTATGLLLGLFLLLDDWGDGAKKALQNPPKRAPGRTIVLWGILFGCWLPALLGSWPGFFANDVTDQMEQIFTGVFNGHSPVLHTVFMGYLIEGVQRLTGSYNTGIAVYTILQMLIMSGIFAYTVALLRSMGAPKWLRISASVYYGLFPLCAMYGVCATKDSLFSAMLLLLILCVYDLLRTPEGFFSSKRKVLRFCIVTFVTLALRNNILVAFAPFALLLVFYVPKAFWKRTAALMAGLLLLMGLYYGPLFSALGIKRGGKPDVVSIPMQQIARAYHVAPEAFTEEDKQILFEILPEHVLEDYEPMLADQIKGRFKATEFGDNLPRYGALYFRIFLRAPGVYLDAFLLNNLYAWYPDSILDGYNRAGTQPYGNYEKCYFEPRTEAPGTMESKWPAALEFYHTLSLDVTFEKVPLLSMLFSIGFQFLTMLTVLCYGIYRRHAPTRAALCLTTLSCLVLLFNPIVLTRYYLVLFFLLPVLPWMAMEAGRQPMTRPDRKETTIGK